MGEGLEADVMHVSKFAAVTVLVDGSEGRIVATQGPYYGAAAAIDVIGGADVETICQVIAALVFLDGIDVATLTSSLSVSSLLLSRISSSRDSALDKTRLTSNLDHLGKCNNHEEPHDPRLAIQTIFVLSLDRIPGLRPPPNDLCSGYPQGN